VQPTPSGDAGTVRSHGSRCRPVHRAADVQRAHAPSTYEPLPRCADLRTPGALPAVCPRGQLRGAPNAPASHQSAVPDGFGLLCALSVILPRPLERVPDPVIRAAPVGDGSRSTHLERRTGAGFRARHAAVAKPGIPCAGATRPDRVSKFWFTRVDTITLRRKVSFHCHCARGYWSQRAIRGGTHQRPLDLPSTRLSSRAHLRACSRKCW